MSTKINTSSEFVKIGSKYIELHIIVFRMHKSESTIIDGQGNTSTRPVFSWSVAGNAKCPRLFRLEGTAYQGLDAFHRKLNCIHPISREDTEKLLLDAIEKGVYQNTPLSDHCKIFLCLNSDLEGKPKNSESKWIYTNPQPQMKSSNPLLRDRDFDFKKF
jgi:hypothetical protein